MNETIKKDALSELRRVKDSYRNFIRDNFEFAAQNCQTCPTNGVCCTDAHFVNVHITRLEAHAMRETLDRKLTEDDRLKVYQRAAKTVEKYDLTTTGDTFAQTFACPLFEPRIGCLVHDAAKPAACISHACYDREADLPPACLQENAENKIEKLNCEIYGEDWKWLPLPVALCEDEADAKFKISKSE